VRKFTIKKGPYPVIATDKVITGLKLRTCKQGNSFRVPHKYFDEGESQSDRVTRLGKRTFLKPVVEAIAPFTGSRQSSDLAKVQAYTFILARAPT
jgi:hypothetical protein